MALTSISATSGSSTTFTAGRGFYILNVLRVLSIISLLTSIVAAGATLVKSFVVTKFFFFDAINMASLSALCIFLILSECSVLPGYFTHNWPLFAPTASLAWQGIAETAVGFCLLGNLNEDFASKDSMGTAFNTLLLASGVIVSVVGVSVFISSFVYNNSAINTTARMARSLHRSRSATTEDSEACRGFEFRTMATPASSPPSPPPQQQQQHLLPQVPERSYFDGYGQFSRASSVYSSRGLAEAYKKEMEILRA